MKETRNIRACSRARAVGFFLALAAAVGFSGCQPKSLIPDAYAGMSVSSTSEVPDSTVPHPLPPTSSKEENAPPAAVLYKDFLTGLSTADAGAKSARPVSIVIDNKDPLLMQSGTADAAIWVEAPIEDGSTRIMLLYSGVKGIPTVASVASTRSYLVELSSAFGAIAVYAGTTDTIGEASIPYNGYDTLDYILQNLSSVFYRDTTVASPYSLLTDGIRITNGILNCRYDSTRKEGQTLPFFLTEANLPTSGTSAKTLYLNFSSTQITAFSLGSDGLYYRAQNGALHTDAAGTEIAFKSLLLLSCDSILYEQQNQTKLDFDLQKGGGGYAVFDGVATPILWKLEADGSLTVQNEAGGKLTLPAGKTYIGLLKSSNTSSILFTE